MARILLVDDDYDIRELGRALLAQAGHEIETADGAISALSLMRTSAFDLVVSDVNMPNHSGFDFLKMIRLEGKWPFITKVMLTGRREKQDVEAAAREGVSAYIVKPFDPEQFVEKINSLLVRDNVVELPVVEFSMMAETTIKIEIKSVSEVGLVLLSPYQFRSGTLLPINSPIFQRIGIAMPLTRVFTSVRKDGDWETRLTYVDLNAQDAEKVRNWTLKQQRPPSLKKKVA